MTASVRYRISYMLAVPVLTALTDRIDARRVYACSTLLSAGGTLSRSPERQMGLRHRAALGITESTDAVSVVVSEETGEICVASNGRMLHRLDGGRLRPTLVSILGGLSPKRE